MAFGSSQWMYASGEDYNIPYSCRFDANTSSYLNRTQSSAGNRRVWTYSVWLRRGNLGATPALAGAYAASNIRDVIRFTSDNRLEVQVIGSGFTMVDRYTVAQFRDPNAWYHIVIVWDSANSTAGDRTIMYVNGVRQTLTGADSAQNVNTTWNNDEINYIGCRSGDGTPVLFWDGYMAEINFLDGVVGTPANFGEAGDYGDWKPIEYTGSYGTNGYSMKFNSSSNLGLTGVGSNTDVGANFTSTNLSAHDQMLDTPTNNFATVNPVWRGTASSGDTDFEGNLKIWSSGWNGAMSTIPMSSGKWYWEMKLATTAGQSFGVCTTNMDIPVTSSQEGGFIINSVGGDAVFFSVYAASHYRSYFTSDGTNWNSAAAWQDEVNISAGSIMGFAVDMDNLDIYMSKEGSWTDVITGQDPEGDPGSNTPFVYHASFNRDESDIWMPVFSNSYNQDMLLNFGNPTFSISSSNADANGYGNFEYAVPDGYYALCTKNIAEFG